MPVFINNVDDYLGPSQACVNPLFVPPPPPSWPRIGNAADGARKDAVDGDGPIAGGGATAATSGENDDAAAVRDDDGPVVRVGSRVGGRRRPRRSAASRIVVRDDDRVEDPPPSSSATVALRDVFPPMHIANDGDGDESDGRRRRYPTAMLDAPPPPPRIVIESRTISTKKKATVTLSDCLSCSGCVTSAESVLLSHHSIEGLREVARMRNRRIVFTISPASLADLYRHVYLEDGECDDAGDVDISMEGTTLGGTHPPPPSRRDFLTYIATYLHSEFGADMVIDGALPQRISLSESASEFCHRYRRRRRRYAGGVERMDVGIAESGPSSRGVGDRSSVPTIPSVALSSTRTRYINKRPTVDGMSDDDETMEITTIVHPPGRPVEEDGMYDGGVPANEMDAPSVGSTSLPMLASSCPGFVCLVEKTAPSAVPLLSTAKSPMAVAGTLVKACNLDGSPRRRMSSDGGGPKSCYHVAIMPCHDKKLEAGRADFAWERQALLQCGILTENDGVSASAVSTQGMLADGVDEDLVKEVDLVLTTGELFEALCDAIAKPKSVESPTCTIPLTTASEAGPSSTSIAIRSLLSNSDRNHSCLIKAAPHDNTHTEPKANDNPEVDTGVHGSGSYADFIFRHAARELFGFDLPPNEPLPWKGSSSAYSSATTAGAVTGVIRRRSRRQESTDLREVTLYENNDGSYSCFDEGMNSGGTSTPVLRFATAYGFKNVQLILQSLSKVGASKSSGFDYVEIMACPSGCSNGGGQIGANGHRETPRETKERVKKTVSVVPVIRPFNGGGSLSDTLRGCDTEGLVDNELLRCERFDENARRLFHTRFHVVPKLELSTGATAGVALSDTRW